eukprot:1825919-Rhodomonas_salina.1
MHRRLLSTQHRSKPTDASTNDIERSHTLYQYEMSALLLAGTISVRGLPCSHETMEVPSDTIPNLQHRHQSRESSLSFGARAA